MPLSLQQVAGYTATETGFVVAWLGVFAVLLSPVAAGSIGKIDIRLSISAGILWMAFVSILRASWNADVDYWTPAWPHRSEERSVGEECVSPGRSRLSPSHEKTTKS